MNLGLAPSCPMRCLVAGIALALAAVAGPAQAANDAICGTTIYDDIELDEDIDCTGFTGHAITVGASGVEIRGNGFALHAPDAARAISITGGISDVTISDLTVSGWCTGVGVYVDGGADITLDGVAAAGRSIGLRAHGSAGLTVRSFIAEASSDAGMSLYGVTGLVLEDVVLEDNAIGLRLENIAGPLAIGAAQITSLLGNGTSIHLTGGVTGVAFSDLVLDGLSYGVYAYASSNTDLAFTDVDASGRFAAGTGLYVGGPRVSLTRVTASRRATGVNLNLVAGLAIDTLTVVGATTVGLVLNTPSGAISLRNLTLEDAPVGLDLYGFNPATRFPITRFVAGAGTIASLARSDVGLRLSGVSNLRVAGLVLDNVTAIQATSTSDITFEDLDLSSSRLTGTGLVLSGPSHEVTRVRANRRTYGLDVSAADALDVTDFTATGCVTGLRLAGVTAAHTHPDFLRLTLSDNTTGLEITSSVFSTTPGRFTLSPADAIDVANSQTGYLLTTVTDMDVEDLAFANPAYGIRAWGEGLRFSRVDFSGPGRGYGLSLESGARHELTTLSASHRSTAFQVYWSSGVKIAGLVATHSGTGLYVYGFAPSYLHPILSGLVLTDNVTALNLSGWDLTGTFDVTPAVLVSAAGSRTGIEVSYAHRLRFIDLVLANPDRGILANTANTNLTFDGVDVSTDEVASASESLGIGIDTGGVGTKLFDVVANHRNRGVVVSPATGLVVDGLTAIGCASTALELWTTPSTGIAPALGRLDLADSGIGLQLYGIHAPMTIDGDDGFDVSGCRTGIHLEWTTDVTLRDLATPDTIDFGINAYYGNTRLTVERVNVSGHGVGSGIRIGYQSEPVIFRGGEGHKLIDVTADHREHGVTTLAASGIAITRLAARHSKVGLSLQGHSDPTFARPVLRQLDLSDNQTGLVLATTHGTALDPIVFDGFDTLGGTGVFASLDGATQAISIYSCSHLRFEDFVVANQPRTASAIGIYVERSANLAFRGLTLAAAGYGIQAPYGNQSLSFEAIVLDGPGDGTGLLLGYATNIGSFYQAGAGNTLTNVSASRRTTGVRIIAADGLVVDGLVATHNSDAGLSVEGAAGLARPSFSDLVLDANRIGLSLIGVGGVAGNPLVLGPAQIDSILGCDQSIQLWYSPYVTVRDLVLDGRSIGLYADGGSNLVVDGVTASGAGRGTGVYVYYAASPTIEGTTADRRSIGVRLETTSNPTLRDNVATRSSTGVHLASTTYPITLDSLTLTDNRYGLSMTSTAGAGTLLLDGAAIASHAGSWTAITLSGATGVTVDTAGLGLTESAGNFSAPDPTSDPLCGTTLTADLVLTTDLDCRGTTGTVLTIGASGITIDGGPSHRKILAPRATTVIASNGHSGLTVKRTDLSGAWLTGDGLVIDGGAGHRVSELVVDARTNGVTVRNAGDVALATVSVRGTTGAAVRLEDLAMPLGLSALTLRDGDSGLVIDGFDGADGFGAPLVLGSAALAHLGGHTTSISLVDVENLSLQGPLVGIDGSLVAIDADATSNTSLTLADLVLTPRWWGGTAITLGGDAHLVDGVTASGWQHGVVVKDATALTLTDLQVDSVTGEALRLEATTWTALTNLRLFASGTGLVLDDVAGGGATIGPYGAGSGAIASLANNNIGVNVSGTSDLRIEGSRLDSFSYGAISQATNSRVTFADLDVSGLRGDGVGMYVAGTEITLSAIRADRRTLGVEAVAPNDLAIQGLDADGCRISGLTITSPTFPLVLEDLSLTYAFGQGLNLTDVAATEATPLVLGPAAITSLEGSAYGINATDVQHLVLTGLTLDNPSTPLYAVSTQNADFRLEDLVLSGRRRAGSGFVLYGSGHAVDDVTVHRRINGAYFYSGSDISVRELTAHGNTYGLELWSVSLPIALVDLDLAGNRTGLSVSGVVGDPVTPWVIGPHDGSTGAISDLSGCNTSIVLANSRHVELFDLALDGYTYGVSANDTSNEGLRFVDLELSPKTRGGGGIVLGGKEHAILGCTATNRGIGAEVYGASGLEVVDFTATHGGTGLYLDGLTDSPTNVEPAFDGLTLTDNANALVFVSWTYPMTIDAAVGLDARRSTTGLYIGSSANLAFEGLVLDNRDYGIQAPSSSDLSFLDVDVSGAGFGYGLNLDLGYRNSLVDVVADRREYGVTLNQQGATTVTGLDVRGSTVALYLRNGYSNRLPLTFADLVLTDNGVAILMDTVNWPSLVLDGAAGIDLGGSGTGISVSGGSNLVVKDVRLDNPSTGLYLGSVTNAELTGLDASGTGRGRGFDLQYSSVVAAELTADRRSYGVYAVRTPGLVIDGLDAAGSSAAGMYLYNIVLGEAPPVLTDLRLTNGNIGLQLHTITTPMTLDATALSDLSGTDYDVWLSYYVHDLTLAGLTLDGSGAGVWGPEASNQRVHLDDVDASGTCRGLGVYLGGSDHGLSGLRANRRAYGLYVSSGDGVTVQDSVVAANTNGIYMDGGSAIPDTTVVADGANTATSFRVGASSNMIVGGVLRVSLPGGDEDRTIAAVSANLVTLTSPLSATPPVGTIVRGANWAPRLTVESSDVCANGTGLLAGTRWVDADGNYWRATSGPTHPGNPGGTGDDISATNTTYTPFEALPFDTDNPYCNQAPLPDAGPDRIVCEGDVVTLDGGGSSDPDLEAVSFAWVQLLGTAVTLTGADTASPTFTAPYAGAQTLGFELLVSDGDLRRRDEVAIEVEPGHLPPTADAGPGQSLDEGAAVVLSAASATDPEGLALTWAWTQVGGPTVTLSDPSATAPAFTAPLIPDGPEAPSSVTLTFRLTVSDVEPAGACGGSKSTSDLVEVVVANVFDDFCPLDPNKTFPGQCGCGIPDTDSDGDLTADCVDGCPADPAKTAPGTCGCGVAEGVDECDLGDAGCHADAACTDLACGFECACGEGFVGDGFSCLPAEACGAALAICGPEGSDGEIVWGVLEKADGSLAGFRCEVATPGAPPLCDTMPGTTTLRELAPMCAP